MTKAEFDILKRTATMQEGINMVVVNRVSLDQMFEIFKAADLWFEHEAAPPDIDEDLAYP